MIIPFQRTLKENFCQRGTKAGKSISMPELFPNIPFKKCKQKGAKNGSDILCVADEEQMFHIPPTISTRQEEALLGSLGLQPFQSRVESLNRGAQNIYVLNLMLKTERISGRNSQIEDYLDNLEEPSLGPVI